MVCCKKFILLIFLLFLICTAILSASMTMSRGAANINTANVEKITGRKGTYDAKENVFKISMPRSDIQAMVGETKVIPSMGLTVWAAFTKMGGDTMVMGDMVLLEDQVNPVMSAALDNGLEVTALHNHFLWDSPKILFMHIGGMGDESTLASAVGKVFDEIEKTKTYKSDVRKVQLDPSQTTLDPNDLDKIFGTKGQMSGGVYKVVFGRTTQMNGQTVGNAMGVNTWATFIGSDEMAVADGDFAMYEGEVQTVLKTLRKADINIVAIHNHMIMEQPRVIFLHFWGVGKAADIAYGLKTAMDTQKK